MEKILLYLSFFGIIIGTFIVATIIKKIFNRYIKMSSEKVHNDPTNYKFLKHSIGALIYLVGIGWAMSTIPILRSFASSLLAGAGILAIVAGMASQHALSNIMSGIFIIIFKPFRVNDRLKIRGNISGVVEDITLRHIVMRDYENKRIIIPNTVISDEIIVNADFVDDKICRWVDFRVSFEADLQLVKQIMREEVIKHPLHIDPRDAQQKKENAPEVTIRTIAINEYSISVRAWAWAKDSSDAFVLGTDLIEQIKGRFDEVGIIIPIPMQEIIQKK